ncbi:protein YhfH [Neobacillus cucumis]
MEGLNMLIKMTEFLKNLPSKKCTQCGKKIEEQHESYVHTCNNCSNNH